MLNNSEQQKKFKSGTIIRKSAHKSIVVEVSTIVKHRTYDKYIKRSKNYNVHDETNFGEVGDKVCIVECRPVSKTKKWRLINEGDKG